MTDGVHTPDGDLQLNSLMYDRFRALGRELRQNAAELGIEVTTARVHHPSDDQPHRAARDAGHAESLTRFYRSIDGVELQWNSTRLVSEDDHAVGQVRILDLEGVLSDEWPGVMYDGAGSPDLRDFRPVDYFSAEHCVGLFVGGDCLYMHEPGVPDDPQRLDLDVFGYCELLLMARGAAYLQNAVRALVEQRDDHWAEHFRRVTPRVFPDFSWDAFESAFHRLRLPL